MNSNKESDWKWLKQISLIRPDSLQQCLGAESVALHGGGSTFIRWTPFFHKQGCCLPREIENWDQLRSVEINWALQEAFCYKMWIGIEDGNGIKMHKVISWHPGKHFQSEWFGSVNLAELDKIYCFSVCAPMQLHKFQSWFVYTPFPHLRLKLSLQSRRSSIRWIQHGNSGSKYIASWRCSVRYVKLGGYDSKSFDGKPGTPQCLTGLKGTWSIAPWTK